MRLQLDKNTLGVRTLTISIELHPVYSESWEYVDGWDDEKVFNANVEGWIDQLQEALADKQFNSAKSTIYTIKEEYKREFEKYDLPVELDYLCAVTAAAFQKYELSKQLLDDYFSRAQDGSACWIEARRLQKLLDSSEITEKGETLPGFEQAPETIWITPYAVHDIYQFIQENDGAMILQDEYNIRLYCRPGFKHAMGDVLAFRAGGFKVLDYVKVIEVDDDNELVKLREQMEKQIIADSNAGDCRNVTFQILA